LVLRLVVKSKSDLKVGQAIGEVRKRLEEVTGKKVVSTKSYKTLKDGNLKALLK
jgi:hypothetical protein